LDDTERGDTQDDSQMDIDQSAASRIAESQRTVAAFEVDFDQLDDELKEDEDESTETRILERIKAMSAEIERMAPNLKAIDRLDGVQNRLKETNEEFEKSRRDAKESKEKFQQVRQKRHDLFQRAFTHIAERIDGIYKELTKSRTHPVGGTAYLTLQNNEVSLTCTGLILIVSLGTLSRWYQVSRDASVKAIP
jgi:structural maintenance of chromosome 1